MEDENTTLFPQFIDHMAFHRYDEAQATVKQMTGQYKAFSTIYLTARHNFAQARKDMLPLYVEGELVAWKYFNLGTWSMIVGTMEEAEAYFAKSIQASTDDDFIAWVYVNWAGGIAERNLDNDTDEAERAMKLIERGMAYPNASEDAKATLRAILGLCYKVLERYSEALTVFLGLHGAFPANTMSTAMVEGDIADLYRLTGDMENSILFARRAWDTMRVIEVSAYDKLSVVLNLIKTEYDAGNLIEALHFAELAIQMAEESRIVIVGERDRLTYFGLLRDCYQQAIKCCLALGNPIQAFNYSEMSRGRALADMNQANPITYEEITLPDDMAIISYYVMENDLIAFVINEIGVAVREIGSMDDVESVFDDTGYPRNLLPGANGKLRTAFVLDRLADQIARPLDELIEGCERLCLIPYGPLHHVPLNSMFDNRVVFSSPSVTVLMRHSQKVRQGQEIISFGYNGGTLNHAESEAIAVGDTSFVGPDATRGAVFESGPVAKWLHFSSHGYFDPVEPEKSYIDLADGPLYAHEIAKLRLSADLVVLSACDSGRTRIAPGEEPFGLIRSFMAAGASSALVTLWPVDEVATRLLMEFFYKYLRAGQRAAKAIRMAQEELRQLIRNDLPVELALSGLPKGVDRKIAAVTDNALHPFAHPYWWAGFILIGDQMD